MEKQLGVIHDVVLPSDVNTRYDLYFTDKRVAIVCFGRAGRFESQGEVSAVLSAFGVPPPIQGDEEEKFKGSIEEETKNWTLDDILKLSKKSCYYTLDEIQELKLILGRKPKFEISSEECESKFAPDPEQTSELIGLLTSVEGLKNKFSIAGNWNVLEEIFRGHQQS
jgi:hypothetical protein